MAQLPFAGMHTVEKLKVLEGYLSAYQKVLKNTNFETVFFDAFAGLVKFRSMSPADCFRTLRKLSRSSKDQQDARWE